jgi:hypothetical protein
MRFATGKQRQIEGVGTEMHRRSKSEKRPRDVIGATVGVGKIATCTMEDLTTADDENAVVALDRMGGKAWRARPAPRRGGGAPVPSLAVAGA